MFKLLKSAFSKVADVLKSKKEEPQEQTEKPVAEQKIVEQDKKELILIAPPMQTISHKPEKQETKKKLKLEVKAESKKEKKSTGIPVEKRDIGVDNQQDELIVKSEQKKELIAKPSLKTKLKSLFSEKMTLSESDLKDIKEKFEIVLLQSDFSVEIIDSILNKFIEKLKGGIEKKKNLDFEIKDKFFETLFELVTLDNKILFSIDANPVKIMFVGPNGCGKTTTIAKLAKIIMDNKKSVVMAAGDTFRAASIEQLREHANNLKVPIIAGNYGSDPTSVAFDAVNFAKNKNINYVLIDTAGRQETNSSLMNELKKMKRVIGPNLVIYVAESIAGQAVVNQVKEFEKEIGVTAFIITKADVDTKGGTAFSLNIFFKKPILFLGTGQGYKDLVLFEKDALQGLFE